ncbi:MAG: HAMP domain-containing histidine kinase [Acidimicrobiia bacterium]|nr:HAMP domain-containing histidine kinase [Acidimicrobiia bacterium]
MRRRLVLVFVAVSVLVALAFVVPLAFLVRSTAEDRAIDAARADAAAVVPALVSGATTAQVESAIGATDSGRDGRMTVIIESGSTLGASVDASPRLEAALRTGASDIGGVSGGVEVVAAVATGPGELSAIRVFVPDSDLHRGQLRAWSALAIVAVALVGISVIVADRLARSVVHPTQELAVAARRLGDGELDTRVTPDGPAELVELSGAFNDLGSRVSSMLDRERELVAELSHRLRTPLTKLRMRLDQITDDDLASELRRDVDDVTAVVNDLIEEARSSMSTVAAGCDAAAVVTDRSEFWSVLAEDQQRPWRFDRGDGPLWVGLSEADLAAAVDVLIENVFSHTDEGDALTVGFRRDGARALICVADAGSGFDDSDAAPGVSPGGSTGLGLDIARRTAENIGGSLRIGPSELGGGEVTLVLPLESGGET